jgi:ribosomal protein S18 acetylase RimI-like enzyme
MTIDVREATPAEHDAAGRVTADAYREFVRPGDSDWGDYLDKIADVRSRAGRTTIIVAVEDGAIIGSATLELDDRVDNEDEDRRLDPDEAHIRMLGVGPWARGRGIGKLLMAECERRAAEAGKRRMTLHTTGRMRDAQRMYESLGYERGPDRVFPDGFVLLSYARPLTGSSDRAASTGS